MRSVKLVQLCRWLPLSIIACSALAYAVPRGAANQLSVQTPVAPDSTPVPLVGNAVSSGREALMLRRMWGLEDIHVRSTASGALIRFSYRVADPVRAKVINDKKSHPYLIVRNTGDRLEVPVTEKVGQLRQTAAPEGGREYWMVFTNVARKVAPGDHVDIVIGSFHARELVVESAGPVPRRPPTAFQNRPQS